MDNTAALADVIDGLLADPKIDVSTRHGLAVGAGIPWVTFRSHLLRSEAMRLGELERIATVLGMPPSKLLAMTEERMTAVQAA